jgi:hypothetical protein
VHEVGHAFCKQGCEMSSSACARLTVAEQSQLRMPAYMHECDCPVAAAARGNVH